MNDEIKVVAWIVGNSPDMPYALRKTEPRGWVLVPRVPTDAQQDAGRMFSNSPYDTYAAMIAATPAPTDRKGDEGEVDAVASCLEDDAAQLLDANSEDERAHNMQRAAEMLRNPPQPTQGEWVLVPRTPNAEMLRAWYDAPTGLHGYAAMIAAAPSGAGGV